MIIHSTNFRLLNKKLKSILKYLILDIQTFQRNIELFMFLLKLFNY